MRFVCLILSIALLWGCGGGGSKAPDAAVATFCQPTSGTTLQLQEVASGFTRPLFVTAPEGDTQRLFILEQLGRIRIYDFDAGLLTTDFLDLGENGLNLAGQEGGERGLLGLAFHPNYKSNRRFFVHYTGLGNGNSVISEFKTSATNPNVANPERIELLRVSQPYGNHNSGMLAFAPDGYLYIGMGDGGSGGDPEGNGQDNTTLLGSMLRIDVNNVAGDAGAPPYAIPASNPYAASANGRSDPRPEIWATGLRNPWRFSFDRANGNLYIGDVGQAQREEVSLQLASSPGGENYGWNEVEGLDCLRSGCDMSGKTPPIHDYDHSDGKCSITGGYVYRGSCMPDVVGWYFFADYCTNQVWKFEYIDGAAQSLVELTSDLGSATLTGISSFGEDGTGELYLTDFRAGKVYRVAVVPTS